MEDDTTSPEVSLDTWAIVELFGHTRVAGKCSNVSIAGSGFIRVEVPAHGRSPAYTRDLSPKAIYAINPCDEAAARAALDYVSASPVIALTMSAIEDRAAEQRRTLALEDAGDPDDDFPL